MEAWAYVCGLLVCLGKSGQRVVAASFSRSRQLLCGLQRCHGERPGGIPWSLQPHLASLSLQMVCEQPEVFASACALARAFPLFTHRSGASRRAEKRTVVVEFFLVGQDNGPVEVSTLQVGV